MTALPSQEEDSRGSNGERGQLDRRGFLTWLTRSALAATAVLVIGQAVRFLSFRPSRLNATVVPVGPLADYPPGALVYVAQARAYVGHDAQGLYAMDAVCPHLGCLVEREEDSGFVCPCHGSHFDADGQVQTGPATRPLRHLHLWLDEDGQLMVDRAQPVEPIARLIT
jgi:cytochrome b6-f complex iron-sulfur subunit